jgi:hypothetical protein
MRLAGPALPDHRHEQHAVAQWPVEEVPQHLVLSDRHAGNLGAPLWVAAHDPQRCVGGQED